MRCLIYITLCFNLPIWLYIAAMARNCLIMQLMA